jgi:outer membrane murein-binding lipoprotein Lpp
MALTGISFGGAAGTGNVGVPAVLDLSQADAEAKLREFDLVPKAQAIEAEGTEGTVFSQNPAARTIRPRGSVVTLLVIKAPIVPPNLGELLSVLQGAVDGLITKLDGVTTTVDGVDTKVDRVETKLDAVGPAVAAVGTKVDGVGTKVGDVDTKVEAVGAKLDAVGAKLDAVVVTVGNVETEAAAADRHKDVLDKLDEIATSVGGGEAVVRAGRSTGGTSRSKT